MGAHHSVERFAKPQEPVSDLFHGLFRPLRGVATGDEAPLANMKLDVTENENAYSIEAELPGIDKKDIDVKIDGNTVSISAKVERNNELKEGERVLRRSFLAPRDTCAGCPAGELFDLVE